MSDDLMYHAPNASWYEPTKMLRYWHEGSNRKLAVFGAKLRLPCGGAWFLFTDEELAFCIQYAADSYNHMSEVYLFDNSSPKWEELKRHLAMYLHTVFVMKESAGVLSDIGIESWR